MLMQPAPGANQGVSRPFIIGLVLLLLFLSMQTDWTPPHRQERSLRMQGNTLSTGSPDTVKEKIIYELSVSNDKLEVENQQLRQHILDLKRALRACNRDNGTILFDPDAAQAADSAHEPVSKLDAAADLAAGQAGQAGQLAAGAQQNVRQQVGAAEDGQTGAGSTSRRVERVEKQLAETRAHLGGRRALKVDVPLQEGELQRETQLLTDSLPAKNGEKQAGGGRKHKRRRGNARKLLRP